MYILNQYSPQKETLYKSVRLQVATIAYSNKYRSQHMTWLATTTVPGDARIPSSRPLCKACFDRPKSKTQQIINKSMVFFTELLFNSPFLSDPGKPLRPWTTSKVWSGPQTKDSQYNQTPMRCVDRSERGLCKVKTKPRSRKQGASPLRRLDYSPHVLQHPPPKWSNDEK